MKRTIVSAIILAITVLFSWTNPADAASSEGPANAPAVNGGPAVLCLPGVYTRTPGDCVPLGPSAYMTDMAQVGISLPVLPLPAAPTDKALEKVDVLYGEVVNANAPVFGSMEDAVQYQKKNAVQKLNGDFVFISYTQLVESGGRKLYQVDSNQWMTANDISRIGVLPPSQGLAFSRTPANDFGWVLTYWASDAVQTKRTPGPQMADYTGRQLNLYEIVQIYDETTVDDELWYLIGPDEWAPGEYIARADVNTTPRVGVEGDRWIEINLDEQTLMAYDGRELVFATIIASGFDPFWTRPGLFQIFEKHDSTPMRGAFEADQSDAYYLEDVPWTMYFDDARALHGAYWRAKMGFEQSHGCVNLTVGDAHWIYDWAQIGDWVYVWDPSGETPSDPSLYGPGAF